MMQDLDKRQRLRYAALMIGAAVVCPHIGYLVAQAWYRSIFSPSSLHVFAAEVLQVSIAYLGLFLGLSGTTFAWHGDKSSRYQLRLVVIGIWVVFLSGVLSLYLSWQFLANQAFPK